MTLKSNCCRDVPHWLSDIRLETPSDLEKVAFPLKKALEHSCFYPASGCDGRPVQFLGGFIHSFFYVDYGVSEARVDEATLQSGFKGYKIVGRKRLKEGDLVPGGWSPVVPPRFHAEVAGFEQFRRSGLVTTPFATWYVLDRDPDFDEKHGPQRFSLFYIAADGVAAYQALYRQNNMAPEVLSIIQPGHAFGGNYTNFTKPDGFLAWTVLEREPTPKYLVCGGMGRNYTQAFWPDAYAEHVEWFQLQNGIGVWRRRQADNGEVETAEGEATA